MKANFRIGIERLGNGYLIDVERYSTNEQRYIARDAAEAIRLISAALTANEEALQLEAKSDE